MLRTIYFYGAGGGALTFLDPVKGTTVTRIPTVGDNQMVTLRGAIAGVDTPATREFVNIVIGSEGDYHDIQLLPKSDSDNLTADMSDIDMVPLGDVEIAENSALSGTSAASGTTVGMFVYEDNEPEVPFPEGRHVFVTSIPSGDQTTALATTNLAQPNASKALSTTSKYYAYACTVLPQDEPVQAIVFKDSNGRCACGPFKGRMVFPSCPLVLDGNDNPAVLAQVQAVTEVTAIWEFIEVPKEGSGSVSAGTKVKTGLASGGSLQIQRGGGSPLMNFGSFR